MPNNVPILSSVSAPTGITPTLRDFAERKEITLQDFNDLFDYAQMLESGVNRALDMLDPLRSQNASLLAANRQLLADKEALQGQIAQLQRQQ